MLVLDTPHTNWKDTLKAHQPVQVSPQKRGETVYHLTALSRKVAPASKSMRNESPNRSMTFKSQARSDASYSQQIKNAGLAPKWSKPQAQSQGQFTTSMAKSEISSAAKALWQQYVALLSGRAVGPLPVSVINAVASYSSSKQAVAA